MSEDNINRILKDIKRIEKAIHYISMVEVFRHPSFEDYREYLAARVTRKYPIANPYNSYDLRTYSVGVQSGPVQHASCLGEKRLMRL